MPHSVSVAPQRSHLEDVFGNPFDDVVLSYEHIVTADQSRELSFDRQELLRQWGAAEEFIPAKVGGRWRSTRVLVDRLLPVFRRDPALGLGFGLTSFMAALPIWLVGNAEQQRDAARVLRTGGVLSVAFHELEHGNDLVRNECALISGPTGLALTGTKQVINNIDRAACAVVFARSDAAIGPRSHSLVLWKPQNAQSVERHGRYRTSGMRGVRLGGVDFDHELVEESQIVGDIGGATETALRAFQVTRAVLPALAVGTLDAGLHIAFRFAESRQLYGTRVVDLPYTERLLAHACGDLLLADAFASTAVRALHATPKECFLLSAACKYIVPELLQDGFDELATLLGSTFYGRVAPFAVLEKFVRDLSVLPIGHAGGMSCLMSIVPSLPRWARIDAAESEPRLFIDPPEDEEPELEQLGLSTTPTDRLTGLFADPAVIEALGDVDDGVAQLVAAHGHRARELRARISAAPRTAFSGVGPHSAFELAREWTLLLAAASALGTWFWSKRTGESRATDTRALATALESSGRRLGISPPDLSPASRDFAMRTIRDAVQNNHSVRLTSESIFPPYPVGPQYRSKE